ncbi:MAG: hypothetical protein AAFZ02_06875 [Pseudomonadota bacterium]
MTGEAPQPEDILASTRASKILAAALLALAVIPGLPVATEIWFDGMASVLDWPALFNWFSAATLIAVGLALRLLLAPQLSGADIRFRDGGLEADIRRLLRARQQISLGWAEIAEVQLSTASRSSDVIALILTTGERIEVPTLFVQPGTQQCLDRLRKSAALSGYVFDPARGLNLLFYRRQVWTVVPAS